MQICTFIVFINFIKTHIKTIILALPFSSDVIMMMIMMMKTQFNSRKQYI